MTELGLLLPEGKIANCSSTGTVPLTKATDRILLGTAIILPAVSRERFSPHRGGENLHTVTSDSIRTCSPDRSRCLR